MIIDLTNNEPNKFSFFVGRKKNDDKPLENFRWILKKIVIRTNASFPMGKIHCILTSHNGPRNEVRAAVIICTIPSKEFAKRKMHSLLSME